ncbi:S41 family peptidase [Chitinimonas sp. BJB300]|uniref:S41 family peptidase n=1 Tax=Chitinimonas sp. BJB300 TaxID=1559339 RepID=UPI000C112314|nr:S41 family peptidase [Chitinimonas sp. BJB300]PHV11565.1 peptidase S41 [Chitinimonas sp. BJB300]TSJ88977.1 peptidase S41 [Chitinimonas sp. BJB300]
MTLSRLITGLMGLLFSVHTLAAGSGYFRFPTIHQDNLVFTAEGDLWTAKLAGGAAQRLTTHMAEESRPAISPDGRWLAFSANYEGTTEVYVMPVSGGLPKRISFESSRSMALGWTPRGEVLLSTHHDSGPALSRIVVAVDPNTLTRHVFPLADANDAVLDERGETLYFIRFGLAIKDDNARAYRGGAMAQLWRYRLDGKGEAERIGPLDSNVRRPMWWQGKLVVISDRSGRDNLWSMAADGTDMQPLTRHQDFDIRTASLGQGKVAYQLGADIRVFDLTTQQDRRVDIQLVSDFDQQRTRWLDKPLKYLSSARFAPNGERVAVTARGQVALAGTGSLRRVELAPPAGSRLWQATLSPDGKWVYAISDASGEQEIWRLPSDGGTSAEQLTRDGTTRRLALSPSPNGKLVAHTDKRGRLWLLDIATRKNQLIDDGGADGNEEYGDMVWSPDSQNLAFVRSNNPRGLSQLALYSLSRRQAVWLTSDKYESSSPAFSPDGHWLYFLSDRTFNVVNQDPWGDRNLGPYFDERSKVYALALQPGNRFPFQPKDELTTDKTQDNDDEHEASKGAKDKYKNQQPKPLEITWTNLPDRLYEVPLLAGNYHALSANSKHLYFLEAHEDKANLKSVSIDNSGHGPEIVAHEVAEYALSQDGKKLFYRQESEDNGEMLIVPASAEMPHDLSKAVVRLSDWRLQIAPRQEWRQMFIDAWRTHRDLLFDRNMRGVNWLAVREKYAPLLARVADRTDLDDLLAQMVGEVSTLHSAVIPGDIRRLDDMVTPAGLGALMQRVPQGWKVAHIYRSEAELPSERSPLQAPGVDVHEGDVIVSVNGRATADSRDFSDLLRNQAGQQVLLGIQRAKAAVRQVVVTPMNPRQQASLRYTDWEQSRLAAVQQASKGRIGYLHLRAMGSNDIASFAREFYAQYDREGLIIDVRRNNGGNIDSWIIEKLLRRTWAFWAPPGAAAYTNMQQTFRGHLVVLTDALTYSDGETFAAGIKALKLGPVLGNRTAGAGVWLSDKHRLADEGGPRIAEDAQFGIDGRWLIEGIGVQPDIEVDNPPHATFLGEDRQLDAAIRYLSDKLRTEPIAPLRAQRVPPLTQPKQAE